MIDKAGLKPTDVNIIQLQPDEAMPAFDSGAIDAWSIWEPFCLLNDQSDADILVDGEQIDKYSRVYACTKQIRRTASG
ncbi:hypothetical protein PO124_29075 [Bacillus licheniformis]|nr:hypothetical protein [Bacillus licheniformis]